MSVRTRVAAGAVSILILGGAATPALADTDVPVDAPVIAEGSSIVSDELGDAPSGGGEILNGVESIDELNEELDLPGQVDGPELPDEPLTGTEDLSSPTGQYCGSPYNFVRITKNLKNTMSVKYSTFVQNKRSSTMDWKFTTKRSGTTEIGGSITLGGEAKVLWLGKIKTEVTASAKKSWTSELGVEAYGKVKAGKTVYGDYGIKREKVYGYMARANSNCTVSNKQYMTVWAPYREGWVISD
ncbi:MULTISPECIES: hypothetical protein [Streptomyces]|uniref:Uncharacterized protein n=1 Tax=Streptomyces glycanivorans TaxID=3033808 RepID=A0ABY9JLI8_9ACTN|nr:MULTISPECIES: hypothetical protein [unclassified Streptomyces]TXS10467.1 hypothetical protein EAO68_27190 [Streptomyces sp. wa22]WLQ67819.1 hypothetical protein P8A20_31545 [Streptomyces sp. Alt3]WSQ81163.1 hypothetical protein OG725_30505 [Streptomyces sp. NBC_01213]WSR51890.1 hypothetical protein OG279_31515 [Streptomyces sp. NBC_01201]